MSRFNTKIQKIWSKEWVLKFLSLCLAVMLWYFVGGEDVVEKNVMVRVEAINLPNDLIISNKFKREIEVTVRGPRSVLLEMGREQNSFQINLANATPGTRVENIENNSIPVSRGIEVMRVQPSTIILSLDNLIQKELPIEAVTTGEVSPGYTLTSLELTPESITINGPETILSRVNVIRTTPINLQDLFESVQLQIPLELDQRIIDLIGDTSVTADITITYETIEKKVSKIPIRVSEDTGVTEISPKTASVTVKIPKIIHREDMDYNALFSVAALPVEGEESMGTRLKVTVVPAEDLIVPLEIVVLEPQFVNVVGAPVFEKSEEDNQSAENNIEE